jgi:hypothetical protein
MKKCLNLAFFYAMAAIACGVFYREFTKFHGFTGRTALAFTHLHLFVLGTVLFLILGLYAQSTALTAQPAFRGFLVTYNIALPFLVGMFFVRGIPQVLGTVLSPGVNAAISGLAGLSHTLLTAALVLLFLALKKAARPAD